MIHRADNALVDHIDSIPVPEAKSIAVLARLTQTLPVDVDAQLTSSERADGPLGAGPCVPPVVVLVVVVEVPDEAAAVVDGGRDVAYLVDECGGAAELVVAPPGQDMMMLVMGVSGCVLGVGVDARGGDGDLNEGDAIGGDAGCEAGEKECENGCPEEGTGENGECHFEGTTCSFVVLSTLICTSEVGKTGPGHPSKKRCELVEMGTEHSSL